MMPNIDMTKFVKELDIKFIIIKKINIEKIIDKIFAEIINSNFEYLNINFSFLKSDALL